LLSTAVVVLTRDCEISDTKTECYIYVVLLFFFASRIAIILFLYLYMYFYHLTANKVAHYYSFTDPEEMEG